MEAQEVLFLNFLLKCLERENGVFREFDSFFFFSFLLLKILFVHFVNAMLMMLHEMIMTHKQP